MDGLNGESRQVRDWFPENVSGCFRLSKNEALNDLDMIHANMARNEIRTRHEIEKPTKRARLVEKLAHELSTHTLMRSEHYTIRAGLDQIRADIAGYRDAVAQSRKNMLFAQREHDALAHTYASVREDFALALELNAQLRAQVEASTRELHAQLDQSHKERMDAEQTSTQLRTEHERQLHLEAEIVSLRDRLQASLNQQTLFEALLTKYREVVAAAGHNTQDLEASVMGPPVLELDMGAAEAEGVADEARQQLELQAQLDEHKATTSPASSSSSSPGKTASDDMTASKSTEIDQTSTTSPLKTESDEMQAGASSSAEDSASQPTSESATTSASAKVDDTTTSSATSTSQDTKDVTSDQTTQSMADKDKNLQPEKVSLDPLLLLIRLRAAQEAALQMQANCRELEVQLLTSAQEAELRDQRVNLLSNALGKATQDLEQERSELLHVRSLLREEQLISKSLRQDLEAAARSRRRLLDELGSEEAKYRAIVDCLGTADARATDAEDSLREVIHEIRVLRNAVTSLQDAYDRVLNERHIAVKQLNDVTAKYQTLQNVCKRLTQNQPAAAGDAMGATAGAATTGAAGAGAPTSGTSWLEAALDASATGAPGALVDDAGTNDILQLKARLARYAALNRALQAELRAQEDVKRASQKEVRKLHKQLSSAMGGKLGEQIDLLERVEPRARDIALRRGVLAVMQRQEQLAQQQQQQLQLQQQLQQQQQSEVDTQSSTRAQSPTTQTGDTSADNAPTRPQDTSSDKM